MVLDQSEADYDQRLLPGRCDQSACNLIFAHDICRDDFFSHYCRDATTMSFHNNVSFSAGEDKLILRGVHAFGEKEWKQICDRYLPDRAAARISNRYADICYMTYLTRGILVDDQGHLAAPPKYNKASEIDDAKAAALLRVEAPLMYDVNRWSLEEDIAILQAVPIFGFMWAELRSRLIPHRHRSHLRKRYQGKGIHFSRRFHCLQYLHLLIGLFCLIVQFFRGVC
jgi:hypothetical protein